MKIHPYCNIWPDMEPAEYERVKESIREHGQRQPITTYKGEIVDGKHRWRMCQELGIRAIMQEWDEVGDLLDFVADMNEHRRHLAPGARLAAGVRFKEAREEQSKQAQMANLRKGRRPPPEAKKPVSSESANLQSRRTATQEAAEIAGVSPRTIHQAAALKKSNPEAFERVEKGEVKLHAAVKQAKAPPPPPVEPEVVTDELDRPFEDPDAARRYLDSRREWKEIVNALDALNKRAKALADTDIGRHFRFDQFKIATGNARRVAKFAIGFAACPLYPNCKRGCKHCHGTGYLTEELWNLMPEELKA